MKLLLLVSLFASCSLACRREDHVNFAKGAMITKLYYRLKSHVIKTAFSASQIACSHLCLKKCCCRSINYKRPSGNDRGICELNDSGLQDVLGAKDLTKEDEGFVFSQFTSVKDDDSSCADNEPSLKAVCKTGWIKNNSFCYKVFDEVATFHQANLNCITEGAGLVWIEDFDELDFLNTILADGEKVFVGMTDIAVEGQWVWMDGSAPKLNPLWHGNHPDGGTAKNCGEYQQKHGFHDKNCDETKNTFVNTLCTACEAFVFFYSLVCRH
ncbi:hypothetical protein OS493_018996 [Desmophyllum pertusum]|uniref:C-type lectin domain-containing protein n=1 Tax=Desmophyllum pertusum TaxID=174260 RepID=A0A9W9Z3E2_9CNID|nr:hypothetical protein OS493_018996 [Desmophyllum pertusum]